jgi:hypothetical protein
VHEEPLPRSAVVVAVVAIVSVLALLVVGLVVGRGSDDGTDTEAAGGEVALVGGEQERLAPSPTEATAPHSHEQVRPATDVAGIAVPVAPAHGHVADAPSAPAPVAAHPHDTSAVVAAPAGASTPTTSHDHGTPATTAPGTTTVTTVPTGPIISVDDPRLTDAQRDAAIDLIDRTTTAMQAFPNETAVIAAGYTSIGDAVTGFEHFVNWGYLSDGNEVDPSHIESIVLRVSGGVKTVESAMYILSLGTTMGDVPDIAGELTTWHNHTNLCFAGTRVVGLAGPDGTCANGTLLVTPPMLHVWITAQPCGPFAGIETSGHGAGCHTH